MRGKALLQSKAYLSQEHAVSHNTHMTDVPQNGFRTKAGEYRSSTEGVKLKHITSRIAFPKFECLTLHPRNKYSRLSLSRT